MLIAVQHDIIIKLIAADAPGAAAVQEVGGALFVLAGLFQVADGAQVVLAGMLRGLQDTRVPAVIAAVAYWGVGLPLGAVLAFPLGLRAPGVWLGLTAGLFAVAGLLLARWMQHLRAPVPQAVLRGDALPR